MSVWALAIAGSDSSGGAGIQADLRAFQFLEVPACTAVTAVTAQGADGVQAVQLVDPEVVRAQIDAAFRAHQIRAVKIGMLGSEEQVRAVVGALRGRKPRHVILDPVIRSSSGTRLLTEAGVRALIQDLLPLATVVTPNLGELAELTGMPADTEEGRLTAAEHILSLGATTVVVTGGHLDGWPTDMLVRKGQKPQFRRGERVETLDDRGTGCLLSSLMAGVLARGQRLETAFQYAGTYVQGALRDPVHPLQGRGRPGLLSEPAEVLSRELLKGVYFVSSADLNPKITHSMGARMALDGGARVVQLREKLRSTEYLVHFGKRIADISRRRGGLFIVNDRVDVALACDADGVHLGPDDMRPQDARRILGPLKLIGVSVGTLQEARRLAPHASYLAVGAIFGSSTKGDAGDPVGLARIREIRQEFPKKPIVAIGGINRSNIASVAEAGADAAAVVSAIVCADDPVAATRALVAEFERGLS